jgi:hypothetical protein
MTAKGFIVLLGLTVLTVVLAGLLAERYAEAGMQRTLLVAVITAAVVFPAAWFAERRGWIRGALKLDDLKNDGRRGAARRASSPTKPLPGDLR